MTISAHITDFFGLPVVEFSPDQPYDVAPDKVAWRVSQGYEETEPNIAGLLAGLIARFGADAVTALVIGTWNETFDTAPPIAELLEPADRFPALRALFLGDITSEECEISWIRQTDLTPLVRGLPKLEELRVRGADQLELEPVRHDALRVLAFESGGLSGAVVRAIGESTFPRLERLELWLGVDQYGGDATVEDLAPILSGSRLPRLRSLGLIDAEIADQAAAALAGAPIVARLTDLDLSLGILSDVGAEALLTGQPLTHLRTLNLTHHYISDDLSARLVAELSGTEVNLSDRQEEDDGERYVAVSE
jgi:hypothetical protein